MPSLICCEVCDFSCSKQSNYNAHILTLKHQISILELKKMPKYPCLKCGKEYKTKSGNWKHWQLCKNAAPASVMNFMEDNKELRLLLLKQQNDSQQLMDHIKEQHKQIQELIPKIGNVTNNNQFNLNVFLNEQCKDAVNWDDFIQMLELNMQGLDLTPEKVIKLICDGIEDLGMYKRPIHCLDSKRKKLCIKNENIWEHDRIKIQDTLSKTNHVLQQKYRAVLKQWEDTHPEWYTNEQETEEYTTLVSHIVFEIDAEQCTHELTKFSKINI